MKCIEVVIAIETTVTIKIREDLEKRFLRPIELPRTKLTTLITSIEKRVRKFAHIN